MTTPVEVRCACGISKRPIHTAQTVPCKVCKAYPLRTYNDPTPTSTKRRKVSAGGNGR